MKPENTSVIRISILILLLLTFSLTAAQSDLKLEVIADDFSRLIYVTHNHHDENKLFVIEQTGQVYILENASRRDEPFLDISGLLNPEALGDEPHGTGLLGFAFHPDYANNGLIFVAYTRQPDAHLVIARLQHDFSSSVTIPENIETLLTIPQRFPNHNGGQLLFGQDGYLYIATGDGGPNGGDPDNNAQNIQDWRGAILRLDVNTDIQDASYYTIPADNPFVDKDTARPEIWRYGLRHPWRIGQDNLTGDILVSDIGEDHWHEVNLFVSGEQGSLNLGWAICEGSDCDDMLPDHHAPIIEYQDTRQHCAITGGTVYRGEKIPALYGQYLYADFCSGEIYMAAPNTEGIWQSEILMDTDINIASFGEDSAGELYIMDSTTLYQLISE